MHESKAPQPRDRAVPLVDFRVAALNLATRSAGTRPRSFTSMHCALAHSRTSVPPAPPGCAARTWRQRLCADRITTAGGPRRVPIAVHQASTGKGGRRTAGYSRGDTIAELALPSSARDGSAVSACFAVISPYDTDCPPSIT